ncbi:unnamed protein product, partial [Symbiodinium sp. CCMP2456]
ESDEAMRRSLSTFLPDSACVFGNVLQVFRDAQEASEAIRLRATLQEKVACARSLPCVNCGFCYKHGRFCPFFQRAEVRVQGPPCPDFSAMGNRAGVHGQHLPAILAGGAKASAGKSAMVIVENVPGFPLHLAEAAYDGYDFVESLQEPYMVGFEFMSRTRKFFAGYRRDRVVSTFDVSCGAYSVEAQQMCGKIASTWPARVQRASKYLNDWSCSVKAKCSYEDLICGGVMFSPAAGRQCLLKELYMGMGFPTFRGLADAAGALGNSQVVPQVGVFALCALASAHALCLELFLQIKSGVLCLTLRAMAGRPPPPFSGGFFSAPPPPGAGTSAAAPAFSGPAAGTCPPALSGPPVPPSVTAVTGASLGAAPAPTMFPSMPASSLPLQMVPHPSAVGAVPMLPATSPALMPKRGATGPRASKRKEDLPAVPTGRKPKPVAVSVATVVKGLGEDILDGVLVAVAPQQFTSYVLQSTSIREKVELIFKVTGQAPDDRVTSSD